MTFCSADTTSLYESHVYILYLCIYVYMCVGNNVWACMYVSGDINTHITWYIYLYSMYKCMYVCMHVCMYVYMFGFVLYKCIQLNIYM